MPKAASEFEFVAVHYVECICLVPVCKLRRCLQYMLRMLQGLRRVTGNHLAAMMSPEFVDPPVTSIICCPSCHSTVAALLLRLKAS